MVSFPPPWIHAARRHWQKTLAQRTERAPDSNARYQKSLEREALKTAAEGGYFLELRADDLVDRFCEHEQKLYRNIHYINYISLPNAHIRDVSPLRFATRLRILNLSGNFITTLDGLGPCRQLIKLDVHSNQIASVPNHHFWSGMRSLRILHLHDNSLSKIETFQFLSNCRKLEVLTLYDTPLYLRKNYRHYAVNAIPTLLVLDRHLVADEEIIEDAAFGPRFAALTPTFQIDTCSHYKAKNYTEAFVEMRAMLRSVYLRLSHNSPVIIIQRYYRGYSARRLYSFIKETRKWAATVIQRWWRQRRGLELMAASPASLTPISRPQTSTAIKVCSSPTNRPKIIINLQKLTNVADLYPVKAERQPTDLDSNVRTFRSVEHLDRPTAHARPQLQHDKLPVPSRQPSGHVQYYQDTINRYVTELRLPFVNPYGSLEVAEVETGDLPRYLFRLSGIGVAVGYDDCTALMLADKQISAQQIRDADTHYHRKRLVAEVANKPKASKHHFTTDAQRRLARVHGTMTLSCLTAVNRAYDDRDRAERHLAQMEKIVDIREERFAAKRRIEASKEEKRRHMLLERHKDKIRALQILEQQQLHGLHHIYKSQELRQRANHLKSTLNKDMTFVNDFQAQQSCVSNALQKHDRRSCAEHRKRDLVDFVVKHRDDELEQHEMMKKFLADRRAIRQAAILLENSIVDAKLLQDAAERAAKAQARVDVVRAQRQQAACDYCAPPSAYIKPNPYGDGTAAHHREPDERWNSLVSSSGGRVGRHHITLPT